MAINPVFHRLQLLVGASALRNLNRCRVILFGVGGVGSWCAEALVRDGVGHLCLVDDARITVSHINRQLQATLPANGCFKAEELRDRLELIHGNVTIDVRTENYGVTTQSSFDLSGYDFVLDALDDPEAKQALLRHASACNVPAFTALDSSGRLDATRIRVADLSCVPMPEGESLWASLQASGYEGSCLAVYSEEPALEIEEDTTQDKKRVGRSAAHAVERKNLPGSAVHVTAVYGMALAGLVVDALLSRGESSQGEARVLSGNHEGDLA